MSGVFATMPWRSASVMAWTSLSHRPSSCAIWQFDRFTPIKYEHNTQVETG